MKEYWEILWYIKWNEQIVSTCEYTSMFTSKARGFYFTTDYTERLTDMSLSYRV
jgi:hypothetical protein